MARPTPAGYRAQVNRICRSYTPKIRALRAKRTREDFERDPSTCGATQGRLVLVYLIDAGSILTP